MPIRALVALAFLAAGCPAPHAADPEFADALTFLFREHQVEEPARLAFAMRTLEGALSELGELDAVDVTARTFTPGALAADDRTMDQYPPSDPANCLRVAVFGGSTYPPDDHVRIQLLADHRAVEPNSPNGYERAFVDDTDACWPDRACDTLRTMNEVLKENLILRIPYTMGKDFRWIDLDLPAPSTVEEGEPVVNEGAPRWAILGRSWAVAEAEGEVGANTLRQQWSSELWLPRGDGGAVRMLSVWFQIDFETGGLPEDAQIATARDGIDDIFRAGDAWLDANGV
jgi:hypothetical protein